MIQGQSDPHETPPGERTSEASGEQQGKGKVPGRPQAPTEPKNRAGDIPQQGMPLDEDPRSASGLTASEIAVIAFTAGQVYKEAIGQEPRDWHAIQALDRKEIVGQVVASMIGQATSPARNHATWCKNMKARGLTAEDDARIGMLWAEMPAEERRKAYLFEAIVRTLLTNLP